MATPIIAKLNRFALGLLIVVSGSIASMQPAVGAPGRNVVLIVADDLGLQLGCYGDRSTKTPHIDALAAQGVRFTRAYCTTASCSASRSVILTGRYNHSTGHYGHSHSESHFSTFESVISLPRLLADGGYRTAISGKYHVAPEYVYPFQKKLPGNPRNGVEMAASVKTWLKEQDGRPFFLYFCPTDPHRAHPDDPFANRPDKPNFYSGVEPTPFSPEKVTLPDWLPDLPEVRYEWAEFLRSVARLDAGIGALLNVIHETGHSDDTLVLLISDNGPPFPGAKTTLYEPGARLPLIVRDPTRKNLAGSTCSARVTWCDLTPTILDFCDVPAPKGFEPFPTENIGKVTVSPPKVKAPYQLHGRSFLKVMSEASPAEWNEIYLSHTFHELINYYPMRVVVRDRHKLIFNVAHPLPFPFASDLQASKTWQAVLKKNDPDFKYGLRTVANYRYRPRFELYDLEADPNESKNLASEPGNAAIIEELSQRMRDWQKRTSDPFESKWDYE